MSTFDANELRKIHKFTIENQELLKEEQNCRCTYCLGEFSSTTIHEYNMDNTALCPLCGIDAAIGEKSGYTLYDTEAFIMYDFFFNSPGPVSEHILDLDLFGRHKVS